jgi:hypothetical protein
VVLQAVAFFCVDTATPPTETPAGGLFGVFLEVFGSDHFDPMAPFLDAPLYALTHVPLPSESG